MPEVKWIKITTDIFDDEKIKLIESMPDKDSILIIWIKLLVQAGKCNGCNVTGGICLSDTIPYTEEMLATIFNRPLNTIRLALSVFKKFGMIDLLEDGKIVISNWEKHQNIKGLEHIKKQTRERVQKFRERQKLIENVTLHNVTITQQNKNKKEIKTKNIIKNFSSDSHEVKLSELLFFLIKQNNPNAKKPNIQSWAKNIDLMKRIDKRPYDEIEKIIKWSQSDAFWSANILSTKTLREKYDQLYLKSKNGGNNGRHSGFNPAKNGKNESQDFSEYDKDTKVFEV